MEPKKFTIIPAQPGWTVRVCFSVVESRTQYTWDAVIAWKIFDDSEQENDPVPITTRGAVDARFLSVCTYTLFSPGGRSYELSCDEEVFDATRTGDNGPYESAWQKNIW